MNALAAFRGSASNPAAPRQESGGHAGQRRRASSPGPPRGRISTKILLLGLAAAPFTLGRYSGALPPVIGSAEAQGVQLPQERAAAPEFPADFKWLNVAHPLRFDGDLKGRVVILDFWTYCCINCMHDLATLAEVEKHYQGQPVVVIGVHSNKFPNEGELDNIRDAVLRYRVAHPVVVDEKMAIWKTYDVSSWPTMAFIDASGQIVGQLPGEIAPDKVYAIVDALLAEGKKQDILAKTPLAMKPEKLAPPASGLAFPGKIIADGDNLFIADSGHNRVLEADADGRVMAVIGSGQRGHADGNFAAAQFDNPQGLAYDRAHKLLYIADTGNHLVRRANLSARHVETILGTGAQVFDTVGGAKGTAQGLDSPWDLLLLDSNELLIAMAGEHQLWHDALITGKAQAWIGSGAEGLEDGTEQDSRLAQPSGLTRIGKQVYFADSEASAVRRLDTESGDVQTLVGAGLFAFGDQDGDFKEARLQHDIGIATDGERLYVADSYNHKIRVIDLQKQTVRTLAGTGKPGAGKPGGELELDEPAGLAFSGGKLYVADTNNQRIVVIDPAAANSAPAGPAGWRELELRFPVPAPKSGAAPGGD